MLALTVTVFVFAFVYPMLYLIGIILFWFIILATIIDAIILYINQTGVIINRTTTYDKLSNGDENDIFLDIKNTYVFKITTTIIDEIPEQFQYRDFLIKKTLAVNEHYKFKYNVRPTSRGEFIFGSSIVFVSSPIGFVKRKITNDVILKMPCYPSFIKLRQYELMAISDKLIDIGIKKLRKIGQSTEFDHIKEYVIGNDVRTINWKATARDRKSVV